MNYEQANEVKHLGFGVNKVLERLGWKWQPKAGEWYLVGGSKDWMKLIPESGGMELGKHIPILEWETIERVLEKAGIGFDWFYPADGVEIEMWWKEDNPNQDPCVIIKLIENESRQKAVMKAVLVLKEIKWK